MKQPLTRTPFPPSQTKRPLPENPAYEPLTPRLKPDADKIRRNSKQDIIGCRWIDGDVASRQWHYCQCPRIPGKSYCATHYIRSIDPDADGDAIDNRAGCEFDHASLPLLDET